MVERPKGFLYTHSPRGRYEEYRDQHAHLLVQTKGEARYLFEKQLDQDAKKYARNKVASELLAAAVLTTGAVVLGIELKRGTLKTDMRKLSDFVVNIPDAIKAKWEGLVKETGRNVGAEAVKGMTEALPTQFEVIKAEMDASMKNTFAALMRDLFERLRIVPKRGTSL